VAALNYGLRSYITGDLKLAAKARDILDAWATTLRKHNDTNAKLIIGWAGSNWARAAELLEYTQPGFWPAKSVKRFKAFMIKQFSDPVWDGSTSNGNWELAIAQTMISVGVFTDSRKIFNRGLALFCRRVPAYFYLRSDGPQPIPPPDSYHASALTKFWYGQKTFPVDGISQETCRDLGHVNLGLTGAINSAEMAYVQGVPLYDYFQDRLIAGVEFNAKYHLGALVPSWLCNGNLDRVQNDGQLYEIAYNHYANRKGLGSRLQNTKRHIDQIRPTHEGIMTAWETFTHANSSNAGRPAKRRSLPASKKSQR